MSVSLKCTSLQCRSSSSSCQAAAMSFGLLVDKSSSSSRWGLKCIFCGGFWRGVTQEPVLWLVSLLWTSKWPSTIIKTAFLQWLEEPFLTKCVKGHNTHEQFSDVRKDFRTQVTGLPFDSHNVSFERPFSRYINHLTQMRNMEPRKWNNIPFYFYSTLIVDPLIWNWVLWIIYSMNWN